MNSLPKEKGVSVRLRQILGIWFFNGHVDEAVALMFRYGGIAGRPIRDMFRAAVRRRAVSPGYAEGRPGDP
jgi:hypothetical protein